MTLQSDGSGHWSHLEAHLDSKPRRLPPAQIWLPRVSSFLLSTQAGTTRSGHPLRRVVGRELAVKQGWHPSTTLHRLRQSGELAQLPEAPWACALGIKNFKNLFSGVVVQGIRTLWDCLPISFSIGIGSLSF